MTALIKNTLIKECVLLMVLFLIYFVSLVLVNGDILSVSYVPYYNYLAQAISRGSLFFLEVPQTNYDLTQFAGNYTMYWGFTPVLFILPFYYAYGVAASDVLYTFIAGTLNIFLFYLLLKETVKLFDLKIRSIGLFAILAGFALISPNFYLSLGGRVWYTNQIISTTYLLLFMLFTIKFVGSKYKPSFLLLSILFFNLAWLGRNSLILYALLYVYVIWKMRRDNAKNLKHVLPTIIISIIIGFELFFMYNYLRFGDIFETGLSMQLSDPRFLELLRDKNYFSVIYWKENFEHYFLNHASLSLKYPHINEDPMGNSIFSVYPLTLFFFFLFQKTIFKIKNNAMFIGIGVSIIFLITLMLMSFVGTGWTQFGSRYFFDAIPLLFLLLVFVIDKIPSVAVLVFMLYGFLINYYGALNFFNKY
jgi:hypothetical protein